MPITWNINIWTRSLYNNFVEFVIILKVKINLKNFHYFKIFKVKMLKMKQNIVCCLRCNVKTNISKSLYSFYKWEVFTFVINNSRLMSPDLMLNLPDFSIPVIPEIISASDWLSTRISVFSRISGLRSVRAGAAFNTVRTPCFRPYQQ